MASDGKGRLPFIAALWAALIVATLSALVPSGLPLSRATGSAFDPATSVVALKARSSAQPVVAPAIEPADPPASNWVWLIFAPLLLSAFGLARRLAPALPRRTLPFRHSSFASFLARAPPMVCSVA